MKLETKEEAIRRHKFLKKETQGKIHPDQIKSGGSGRMLPNIRRLPRY